MYRRYPTHQDPLPPGKISCEHERGHEHSETAEIEPEKSTTNYDPISCDASRVRQFRVHFFRYEAKCEMLTFFPVSNKNKFILLINSLKFFSLRSEMRNAHIFLCLERKRIRVAHPRCEACVRWEVSSYRL